MTQTAPDRPYEPERTRSAVRGRVVVKLASGQAPERVPHYLEVQRGLRPAGVGFGRSSIDRVLRRHAHAARVSQVFRAARSVRAGDAHARSWDDLEERIGMSRTFRVDVDAATGILPLVQDLAELSAVESVSPQYLCQTPFAARREPESTDPAYAQRMIHAAEALEFEPGDSALVVGVVDSGIALDHLELRGALRRGVDTVDLPQDRLSRGLILVGDTEQADRIPRDEMGHGTACASILRAAGKHVPRGLAGAAWVLPMRALAAARVSERGALTALGAVSDIDECFKLAVDLGARVLNLSFGTPEAALRTDDPKPHADVVAYALERGCVLVAASGNDGREMQYYPAAHPGVIAVGSVGENAMPSAFSTRGEHVALCAPGERVYAASLDGYQYNTGTSFAAPFVAGACALLCARAARYGVPLSAEGARTLLCATARPFAGRAAVAGCGAGILDAHAALLALESALTEDSPLQAAAGEPNHTFAPPA